ncbi:CCT domain containing protein [Parasponia andersonii]|uniref:CCT domain containing protein n=1 Tax=Parasponia andersonii TaxID=3476 RepID=A0A2P5CPE0_PARAD|nr:CCT domain containing protein [Parasponia andersonii]
MSSDLFVFDGSFYNHSSPEVVSLEPDLFFGDELSPFSDSAIDIFQAFSDHQTQQNPVEESHSNDHISSSTLSSSSPPSHQLESLNLYQPTTTTTTHLHTPNLPNGFSNFAGLDAFQVKTEECQMGFDNGYYCTQNFGPHSYSGSENVAKLIQRSFSSNSFDGKPDFSFTPRFDTLMESPSFQNQALSSPENGFLTGQMRRVCSTGDLQNFGTARTTQRSFSSPLASESSFMEEPNFKVGKYSAEERKERISKYRAKRTLRNFNKTIKYACRKTLADNRPRIRGRFARNDEPGELPKAACSSTRDEDEDELWLEGLHEEEEDNETVRGQFVNSYGPTQFQYYGF